MPLRQRRAHRARDGRVRRLHLASLCGAGRARPVGDDQTRYDRGILRNGTRREHGGIERVQLGGRIAKKIVDSVEPLAATMWSGVLVGARILVGGAGAQD